jgi:uncharacterized membrane protein YbaN (DUF454 family)
MNKLMSLILVSFGSIFVALGVIGIFLPVLPTTPFLLLGAACYIKGSDKMYKWLINNKYLGEYIKNYREKNGIPLKSKIIAISTLWPTMLFTVFFVIDKLIVKVMLLIIASIVTWYIAKQKTLTEDTEVEKQGI